jgi:hypothetical protein
MAETISPADQPKDIVLLLGPSDVGKIFAKNGTMLRKDSPRKVQLFCIRLGRLCMQLGRVLDRWIFI